MSDVSEHDSDSDTEIRKKEEKAKKQQQKAKIISSAPQISNAPQGTILIPLTTRHCLVWCQFILFQIISLRFS